MKKYSYIKHDDNKGFSLVELSIVLVIVGLITGGVLAGRSLIRAAELRTITTDISNYQTAAVTFVEKYGSLPGDLDKATLFWGKNNAQCSGAAGSATSPGTCNGNDDGLISFAMSTGNGNPSETAEVYQFWTQLAYAGLINGQHSGISGSVNNFSTDLGSNVPRSNIKGSGFQIYTRNYAVGSTSRFAYNYVNTILFGADTHIWKRLTGGALTPEDALSVDMKFDDGIPGHGNILAANWNNECSETADGSAAASNKFDTVYRVADDTKHCALHFMNRL